MEAKAIALTDMVRRLGFQDAEALANKLRRIFKEKEHFGREYAIEQGKHFGKRDEKFLVKESAETLVDNLAILSQFSSFFGRAKHGSSEYKPYKLLKRGIKKDSDFKAKLNDTKRKFALELELTQIALTQLPIFFTAVTQAGEIDITKDSLRDLMEKAEANSSILDMSRSYQIGVFEELIDLQDRLDTDGPSSFLYQQIGECLLALGEVDQAVESLQLATSIDETNGVAWALLANQLHKDLGRIRQVQHSVLAMTDFSGPIDHPITSEEQWINERFDTTQSKIAQRHDDFVHCAVRALFYWPTWNDETTSLDSESESEKPNYCYYLNQSLHSNAKISRNELFLVLIQTLRYQDIKLHRVFLTEIYRSFQWWIPENYPLTSIRDMSAAQTVALIQFTSWISEDDLPLALEDAFCEVSPYNCHQQWDVLQAPKISPLLYRHLGVKKYNLLTTALISARHKENEAQALLTISGMLLADTMQHFLPIKQKLKKRYFISESLDESNTPENANDVSDKELITALSNGMHALRGWHEQMKPYNLHGKLDELSRYSQLSAFGLFTAMVEVCNGKVSKYSVSFIDALQENRWAFETACDYFDNALFNLIWDFMLREECLNKLATNVKARITRLNLVKEEIEQQRQEDLDYYG